MQGVPVVLLAAAVVGAAAIPLLASPGDEGQPGFLEPSAELPWPQHQRDPGRIGNAGAGAAPGLALSTSEAHNASIPPAHDTAWYRRTVVGDLDLDDDPDIIAALGTAPMVEPTGRLFAIDTNGSVMWRASLPGNPAPPVVADLVAGSPPEVFVSIGREHRVYSADGEMLWAAVTDAPAGPTWSRPLPVDADGDGGCEIVQALGAVEEDPTGGEAPVPVVGPQPPAVVGFDGATGRVLFEHEIPCGRALSTVAGMMVYGTPNVYVACAGSETWEGGPSDPVIQALELASPGGSLWSEIGELGGAADPVRPTVAWEHTVDHEDAQLDEVLIADVAPPPGPEIVLSWGSDAFTGEVLGTGFAIFTPTGEVLWEGRTDVGGSGAGINAAGDLDQDGYHDVLVLDGEGYTAWDLSGDEPTVLWRILNEGPEHEPGYVSAQGASLADLDGDGDLEVVAGWQHWTEESAGGFVRVYTDKGEMASEVYLPPADEAPTIPIRGPPLVDLDGDGAFEIVYPSLSDLFVFETR